MTGMARYASNAWNIVFFCLFVVVLLWFCCCVLIIILFGVIVGCCVSFFANVFNGSDLESEGMRDVSINPLEGKLVPLEEWQQHLNTRFVCSPR